MNYGNQYFDWIPECGRMVDEYLAGTSTLSPTTIFAHIESSVKKFFIIEKDTIKRNLTSRYNLAYIDECRSKVDFTTVKVYVPNISYYIMSASDNEFYCASMVNKALKGLATTVELDELRIKCEKSRELRTETDISTVSFPIWEITSMDELIKSLPNMDNAIKDNDAAHTRMSSYFAKLKTVKPEIGLAIAYQIAILLTTYNHVLMASLKYAYMEILSECRKH